MRCKKCNYRLWNLTSRQCPECGTPFLPSQFEFVVNSVRFCCPHCLQAYYGTGDTGHLVPAQFDCVSCGRPIHMDEMAVLPAEGVTENQTEVARMPWLDRKQRGFLRGWLSTIWMSLIRPGQLIRTTPANSSVGEGWWFSIVTHVPLMVLAFGIVFGFFAVITGAIAPSRRGAFGMGIPLFGLGFAFGFALLGFLAFIAIWGLITHGLLRLTGGTEFGIGRTFQAITYSSGANVVLGVPCVGWYFGWIWWLVSSVIMVKEGQKVHGGRAAFAVLTTPLLTIGGYIAFYAVFLYAVATGAGPFATITNVQSGGGMAQFVLDAVLDYATDHSGAGPAHAVQLVTDGDLSGLEFVSGTGFSTSQNVLIGNTNLLQFFQMNSAQQKKVVNQIINSRPPDVVAHRLGDFVFTYHGIDLTQADRGLWIIVLAPESSATSPTQPRRNVTVGLADGSVKRFPPAQLTSKLAAQNALRAQYGLPPLPNPTTVTHLAPALAGEADATVTDDANPAPDSPEAPVR